MAKVNLSALNENLSYQKNMIYLCGNLGSKYGIDKEKANEALKAIQTLFEFNDNVLTNIGSACFEINYDENLNKIVNRLTTQEYYKL